MLDLVTLVATAVGAVVGYTLVEIAGLPAELVATITAAVVAVATFGLGKLLGYESATQKFFSR